MDRFKWPFALLGMLIGVGGVFGEGVCSTGDSAPSGLFVLLLRTVGSIALVVALIFGFVYALRRFVYLRGHRPNGKGIIEVVGSNFLQPKKALYVVRVMDRVLVLGVTDTRISLLCQLGGSPSSEVPPVEPPEDIEPAYQPGHPKQFSGLLGSFVDRLKGQK